MYQKYKKRDVNRELNTDCFEWFFNGRSMTFECLLNRRLNGIEQKEAEG